MSFLVRASRRILPSLASLLSAIAPFNVAWAQQAALVSPPLPGHYLVVYRNGQIPEDAETRMGHLGAKIVQRHERMGIVSVSSVAASAAQLAGDPAVEYVVRDRVITAHRVLTAAIRSGQGSAKHRLATTSPPKLMVPQPLGGAGGGSGGSSGTGGPGGAPGSGGSAGSGGSGSGTGSAGTPPVSVAPVPTSLDDSFYSDTPQGWAVKAVGGFGKGLDNGSVVGAWNTTTGKGVRIAVLDSGMDVNHPDIAPNLGFSLSEIDQNVQPSACDDGTPQDQAGHGTWVASLAAGAVGSATGRVVGVAPAAMLLNIKVLQRMPGNGASAAERCANGEASGLVSWLLKGIDDAVSQHADVIVLSLGSVVDLYAGDGAGLKASFDRATHAAAQADVVIVAAAGNDGYDLSNPRYLELPAQARDVLAVVASTNPDCMEDNSPGAACTAGAVTRPYYSNYGAPLNAVAAPGGSYPEGGDEAVSGWVRGACSAGIAGTADGMPDANHSFGCFNLGHQRYVQAIGTSASAPLVGGVAALVRAVHPDWSAAAVVAAIRGSAKSVPQMSVGIADAMSALSYRL